MARFNNDYNQGANPRILEVLAQTNGESYPGYGLDPWCERASAAIRAAAEAPKAAVHFAVGGTQANVLVISSALRAYEGVISADTGHINVHETGAVEHAGHKVHALPSVDGKITADQVEAEVRRFEESTVPEHVTEPKMVYLSQPTEFGTLYSARELDAINEVCRAHGLYLFVDGARLAYALAAPANDVTLPHLASCADAFTVGGTKCGALFGEGVVFSNPALARGFRSHLKQQGALLAKGWLLGLQFATLFEEGLYVGAARHAVEQALRIKEAFAEVGVKPYIASPTNQQFFTLPDRTLEQLGARHVYEYEERIDEAHSCVRFCTSWATSDGDVDELVRDIREIVGGAER